MQEKWLEEWHDIFTSDCYIYGAAKTAERCYDVIEKTGHIDNIKGFLVSNGKDNVATLRNLPVMDIHKFDHKEATILICHKGYIRDEICDLLQELGYSNYVLIANYMSYFSEQNNIILDDRFAKRAQDYIEHFEKKRDVFQKAQDKILYQEIVEKCRKENPDFGGAKLYQSFEPLGFEGTRPSCYRIEKYGIREILKKSDDILDIGCNTGFFDMIISTEVHSIVGVEYDKTLCEIANLICKYTQTDNCTFINSDYIEWSQRERRRFNIVFSFAIHRWLPISSQEYIKLIDAQLEKNGYLVFESHDIKSGDEKYYECYEELVRKGYKIIRRDNINDEYQIVREFFVAQK